MKIYISHASSYDYATNLYEPLKLALADHELILPHSVSAQGVNAKEIIPTCDLMIAEVSHPSTGQGIEIGWANAASIPILCVYEQGSTPSSALTFVCDATHEYGSTSGLIKMVRQEIR